MRADCVVLRGMTGSSCSNTDTAIKSDIARAKGRFARRSAVQWQSLIRCAGHAEHAGHAGIVEPVFGQKHHPKPDTGI